MRVVFFGDSNTYGFDPRDPFDDRYPASVRWTDRLQRMLDAAYAGTEATCQPAAEFAGTEDACQPDVEFAGTEDARLPDADMEERWTVISRGQNGRCVPVMPQMSGYIQSMIREVWPVDRFAVMLGTNDLLLTHHPDAALPAAQMRQFLLFLRMKYPEMERMLIAPPVLFETLTEGVFFRRCREESRRLTQMYEKIANETQTIFVDAGKWTIDLASDYVHFSEKGHMQFAEQIRNCF